MDNDWLDFCSVVLDTWHLKHRLRTYRRVNDKINYMVEQDQLIPLKKGKYISAKAYLKGLVSDYVISNSLYGPSYVSGFSAMSYHGMIPEKVVRLESVTTLRSKIIHTPIRTFQYYKTPTTSFHIGIQQIEHNKTSFLMASPTKALIDTLWILRIKDVYGVQSMSEYLLDNLRLDESVLITLDTSMIAECAALGKRKKLLNHLIKVIEENKN